MALLPRIGLLIAFVVVFIAQHASAAPNDNSNGVSLDDLMQCPATLPVNTLLDYGGFFGNCYTQCNKIIPDVIACTTNSAEPDKDIAFATCFAGAANSGKCHDCLTKAKADSTQAIAFSAAQQGIINDGAAVDFVNQAFATPCLDSWQRVRFTSVSYGGTGCPQGSVGFKRNDDITGTYATLGYDSFIASSGPGVPVTEGRKNCQLNYNLRVPRGFRLTQAQFVFHVFVDIPADVSAEIKATYYWVGQTATGEGRVIDGPFRGNVVVRDALLFAALSWCEHEDGDLLVLPLNVNSQARLIGSPSATAQVVIDVLDAKAVSFLGLDLAPCVPIVPPPPPA